MPPKKGKVLYAPAKPVINKMKSACEHRAQMALELFEGEIMNIPHSLTPDSVSLYHGNKADIAKRLNSEELLPEQDGKSWKSWKCLPLFMQHRVPLALKIFPILQ